MIKYKNRKENILANALSQRFTLLSTLDPKILGFEYIKYLYVGDFDFGNVFNAYKKVAIGKFFGHNSFLFKEK